MDDVHLPFQYFPSNDHLMNGINPEVVDRMKWLAKGFYTVEKEQDEIRFYNLQVDMRGIVDQGGTKAPTAGYFIIMPKADGSFEFSSGSHRIK